MIYSGYRAWDELESSASADNEVEHTLLISIQKVFYHLKMFFDSNAVEGDTTEKVCC